MPPPYIKPKLSDDDRAAVVTLIQLMGSIKGSPTLTVGQAMKVLGCKEDYMRLLVNEGHISGYRLPTIRRKQPGLPQGQEGSATAIKADRRHYRIPSACVLLTAVRHWIGDLLTHGFRPTNDEAVSILAPIARHLHLTGLRALRLIIDDQIKLREEQLTCALGKLPKTGPRSPAAMEASPELFPVKA